MITHPSCITEISSSGERHCRFGVILSRSFDVVSCSWDMFEAATNRDGLDKTTRRFIRRDVEMSFATLSFVELSVTDTSFASEVSFLVIGKVASSEILKKFQSAKN
jgi:hypothetical protein